MKTKHEQLKEICDLIGYEINTEQIFYKNGYRKKCACSYVADVREIIFTQEFMDKLFNYRTTKFGIVGWTEFILGLVEGNLDNPVEYLYKIIKGT